MFSTRCAVLVCLVLAPSVIAAHEFWLEPKAAQVTTGAPIEIDFRVGQRLKGETYPFLADRAVAVWQTDALGVQSLTPRWGDLPAIQIPARVDGVTVLGYQSRPSRLTYESFEPFEAFLVEEGLGHIAHDHLARGLPPVGFAELFSRYAKTAINLSTKTDPLPGTPEFRFDLSLLSEPHGTTLELSWEGKVLADYPVAIVSQHKERRLVRSDGLGRITLPERIEDPTLINAVFMEPIPDTNGAVWHSHWASYYLFK